MSTVISSCSLLSLRSAVRPGVIPSGRSAAVAVVSQPRPRPRPLSVCCASSQKGDHNPKTDLHPFNIPAFVLVHPVPPREEERWQLEEEAERVNLWFEVPGQSKDELVVQVDEDVLVIKKVQRSPSGGGGGPQQSTRDPPPPPAADEEASKEATTQQQGGEVICARMLLPAGYSREGVEAELKSGVLRVSVAKIKKRARRTIAVRIDEVKQ